MTLFFYFDQDSNQFGMFLKGITIKWFNKLVTLQTQKLSQKKPIQSNVSTNSYCPIRMQNIIINGPTEVCLWKVWWVMNTIVFVVFLADIVARSVVAVGRLVVVVVVGSLVMIW